MDCFNRYMVECECICSFCCINFIVCFNRYMVECESEKKLSSLESIEVLIDTWWNVNEFLSVIDKYFTGFNRYMVECELGFNNGSIATFTPF